MTQLLRTACLALCLVTGHSAFSGLKLPSFFSDRLVLQQGRHVPVWGWDAPGRRITVSFAGEVVAATVGADGRWQVLLPPLAASREPRVLTVDGSERVLVRDVLVGEVWLCSGQSNMNFLLRHAANGDLEQAVARDLDIRLLKLPQVGSAVPQDDIPCTWRQATPETAAEFSAVGFLFGRILHDALGVPIGLIHNAWGGSEAEAWVRRKALEDDPRFAGLIGDAVEFERRIASGVAQAEFPAAMARWNLEAEVTRTEKRPLPAQPYDPARWLTGNSRPGSIFNGMI